MWQDYSASVTELRRQLRDVPKDDRATCAIAAEETSAAFAAWSERVEATPGPLAEASRVLARSAQIRKHQVKPKPSGMASASGAALLLMMASKGGKGTVAEPSSSATRVHHTGAVRLRQRHPGAADRYRLRARLDSVRARLPELLAELGRARRTGPVPAPTNETAAETAQRLLGA